MARVTAAKPKTTRTKPKTKALAKEEKKVTEPQTDAPDPQETKTKKDAGSKVPTSSTDEEQTAVKAAADAFSEPIAEENNGKGPSQSKLIEHLLITLDPPFGVKAVAQYLGKPYRQVYGQFWKFKNPDKAKEIQGRAQKKQAEKKKAAKDEAAE